MAVKQTVRLMNGTLVEVDSKAAFLLAQLEMLYGQIADGKASVVFMARKCFDPEERMGTLLCFWDEKSLHEMSDTLLEQSKRCRNLGTLWEGNAPVSNRSFGTN